MDNIVSDNGFVIGTLEHLRLLYYCAREKDELSRKEFDPDNYKFVLGARVFMSLQKSCDKPLSLSHTTDTMPVLYGIKVDIDYRRPEAVELWENITDKI